MPGQHADFADPPCAHCQENGQHHREFLGQHRHSDGDPGEGSLGPAAAQEPVQQHDECRDRAPADGAPRHYPGRFGAQARCLGIEHRQRRADPADLAVRAGCQHAGKAAAAHDEGARIDEGLAIPARSLGFIGAIRAPRDFANRQGFSGQQRLIGLQVARLDQDGVGGDAVSGTENESVSGHNLASGDAGARAIADDRRTGGREVAERLQDRLRACLLHDCHRNRKHRKSEQNQRLTQVTQDQIGDPASQQQSQHRLAYNPQGNVQ